MGRAHYSVDSRGIYIYIYIFVSGALAGVGQSYCTCCVHYPLVSTIQ